MTDRSRSHATAITLLAIVLISGTLKSWGLHWGLPTQERFTTLYVDEYTPLWVLQQMHPAQRDFNPHYSHNPTFFYYQLGAVLAAASKMGIISIAHDKNYYLAHPEQYAQLYLTGRALCVAYGIAATILFFFLGKRVTGSDVGGLWTAFLHAVIPISSIQCHVIDTSVPASFWLGLSFLALLQALSTFEKKWIYWGALAAGLSLSTKYTCAPIVLPVIYTTWRFTKSWKHIFGALAIAGLGYAMGTPYMILDAAHMVTGLLEMSQSAAGLNMAPGLHSFWYPLAHYAYTMGVPLSIAILLGLFLQADDRDPAVILSLLFLVPFLGLLARSSLHVARYLNETLPFLLPFAACPLLALLKRKNGYAVAAGVFAVLCLSRAPYTLAMDRSLATEMDPRDRASAWMDKNIPTGKTVGLEQEANFMMPAHVYMEYWKGQRYPASSVRPPHYTFSVWDREKMAWAPRPPDTWIETNLFFSGVFKNTEQNTHYAACAAAMKKGYSPQISFERDIHWGPIRYSLPVLAGNDWRIFLPKITLYARR